MKTMLFAVSVLASFSLSQAQAGEFDGWCWPADGCTGEELISDDSYSTCEDSCTLSDATKVNDMNAILYRSTCSGDMGTNTERMFFMKYLGPNGEDRALVVADYGSTELVRCKGD